MLGESFQSIRLAAVHRRSDRSRRRILVRSACPMCLVTYMCQNLWDARQVAESERGERLGGVAIEGSIPPAPAHPGAVGRGGSRNSVSNRRLEHISSCPQIRHSAIVNSSELARQVT